MIDSVIILQYEIGFINKQNLIRFKTLIIHSFCLKFDQGTDTMQKQNIDIPTYKGLSNIGATCYMNSLLQTLFMTPQLRKLIYEWKYDPKIHPQQADSIIYQLQRLFCKLETRFPAQVSTKDLAKSFQWMDQQVLVQQDIQQFNRVLFEALQKSFQLTNKHLKRINTVNSKKYTEQQEKPIQQQQMTLKNLYEGSFLLYTKCDLCGYQSTRAQIFQDIILTIKNIHEKVYNNTTELALQRYLKPEKLDQDNKYECSNCMTKVTAQRGTKFLKMPKLLNVILQRFNFDYFTMQRQKINDYHQFPFIINFNNYMHGYEQIPNKLNEDSSSYFPSANKPLKKTTVTKTNGTSVIKNFAAKKSSKTPNVAGKLKTKPLAQTKSFLKEMRKKKNFQDNEVNEDLIYVSGSQQMSQPQFIHAQSYKQIVSLQKNEQKTSKSQQIRIQCEMQRSQTSIKSDLSNEDLNIKSKKQSGNTESNFERQQTSLQVKIQSKILLLLPPPLDLVPPSISQPYKRQQAKQIVKQNINGEVYKKPMTMEQQIEHLLKQKQQMKQHKERQQMKQQKESKLRQLTQKCNRQIQKYLKDGPLVYQLYAVMIHAGSATHGHYHSYIKSFEDGKWYCFNDERVSEVNVMEINKSYGGSGNSSAYALYYRMVNQQDKYWHVYRSGDQNTVTKFDVPIPECIRKTVQQQIGAIKTRQKQKLLNLQNIIILKISYQLYVKQIQMDKCNSLQLCLDKAIELFNIDPNTVKKSNYRLRMYNPVSDTKLDTYTGRQKLSLQELKIGSYKNLLLEVKKDEEQFEEFQTGFISLRIVLWEDICDSQIKSLEQGYLKLHKVSVNRFWNIKQVEQKIRIDRIQILKELKKDIDQTQQICIVKRHQNDQYSYHQVINSPDYKHKSLDDVMVIENEILYIQAYSEHLNWPREFQTEIYRINIKYNSPNTQKNQVFNLMTDSRITLAELKNKICDSLRQFPDDIILKRGNKNSLELKNTELTLKEHRFINGTQLYLEKGIAAKQGQIRIQLYFANDASVDVINRLHEFDFIADVPINGQCKASEVKQVFRNVIKKLRGIDLELDSFRIREKVSDKIGKIYRQRPMKQQQLIEKRQIAVQLKKDIPLDAKQFSIYVRQWDQQTWKLSQKEQFIVSKSTSMLELGEMILQTNLLKDVDLGHIHICRVLSIHKFSMLDLVQLQYFPLADLPVIGQPLFVNADGLLFIVKNIEKQVRDLSKQQEKRFGGTVKPKVNPNRYKAAPGKKQKAMLIKVVDRELTQNQKMEVQQQNPNKQS